MALKTVLLAYKGNTGSYPTTEQGLGALVKIPDLSMKGWSPMVEHLDNDPWGQPYQYRCPGNLSANAYDLFSLGPDGKPSKDDVYPE